ncbi:hypothetical protein Pint_08425 [Pistacia integerrima]|uniref:Uncharacterized protein n=1 Tax=Pistacia integerrima TaxID=434235 RepID=A0ACC0XWB5_9ROSI|nr:hypothetical protein Pint_08425 [Pistacia integerrima]
MHTLLNPWKEIAIFSSRSKWKAIMENQPLGSLTSISNFFIVNFIIHVALQITIVSEVKFLLDLPLILELLYSMGNCLVLRKITDFLDSCS